ncbi:MAG: hypothetical protein IJX80_04745 [Clostridia bacterium]|nr:hypothetical protein [Clostridia bacterium]
MCVIAGYSGKRRGAPILIEMMKKIEYVVGGYTSVYPPTTSPSPSMPCFPTL